MATLAELISDPTRRNALIADGTVVVDQEVADKSGLGGIGVKSVFAMVKALKPGVIPELIEGLLPEFCEAIDPILAKRAPGADTKAFLNTHSNEVVQALLSVTDQRARKSTHATLVKLYQKLRPTAEKNVAAALPRVANVVDRHLRTIEKPGA